MYVIKCDSDKFCTIKSDVEIKFNSHSNVKTPKKREENRVEINQLLKIRRILFKESLKEKKYMIRVEGKLKLREYKRVPFKVVRT